MDSWSYNIGLTQATMPSLRTLKLTNTVLREELREFCLCHINTLKSISLHDCHAHGGSGENRGRVFNGIANAAPPRLKEFDLDEDNKESVLDFEGYWRDAALIERAREKIAKHPEARAFPYAYLDDRYGLRGQQGNIAIENYLLGADDKALTELMDTIQRNNESL